MNRPNYKHQLSPDPKIDPAVPIEITIDPAILPSIAREKSLSRLLMAHVMSGLFFMLLPGTFLGVWNLLSISSARCRSPHSPSFLQFFCSHST